MFEKCSKLVKLSLPSSMSTLHKTACSGVGTEDKPCTLLVPDDFTFPDDIDTSEDVFEWCSGYFTLGNKYPLGDVNHDGDVDVADVMLVVNYVLDYESSAVFYIENADVNGDGSVGVSDVMGIVNIVLGL